MHTVAYTISGPEHHTVADLLHRRPCHQAPPPRLHAGVRVEERCMRRRHEVEGVREVVEVREAEEVSSEIEVLVLRQVRLVDIEHLLELLQALLHDLLVGRGAEPGRVHDALVEDGRDGGQVGVRLNLRPHVHHRGFLWVACSQQVDLS